jgi:hypothetical protein
MVAALAVVAFAGCDLLDVDNPNNLVEESIRSQAAASAVVNGSEALVSSALSQIWQPYLVASDEMYWIGSRDAWLELDKGFVSNVNNEFTDGAFPSVGQARWMADEAVEILTEHASADASFSSELARAQLFAGMIYMVIGEVMEDFAFSDKTEDGPAIGPSNMSQVLDDAITYLNAAVSGLSGDMKVKAQAVRARAIQSRAIWDRVNPASGSFSPVNVASAEADALAVITAAGGVTSDWNYDLTYSSASVGNDMAGWINDRKENQFDLTLVTVDAAKDISGIAITDPIDGTADMGFMKRLQAWKESDDVTVKGGVYPPLTVASARQMHLILAENALANTDAAGFEAHINHVRAMDGDTPWTAASGVSDVDILHHERRTNLAIMGLRLADMYRFGVDAAEWEPNSPAVTTPGTMLPITAIEIRANCHLNGLGCGG